MFQLFWTLGILLDYALGSFNSYYTFSYSITAATIIYLVSLIFIPESPHYLIRIHSKKEAETSLRRLRGKHYNVQTELDQSLKELELSKNKKTAWNALCSRANVKGLTISVGLMVIIILSKKETEPT